MALEYFCCFYSYRKKTANLSDSEVGRLFRSLMEYGESGVRPDVNGREAVAFDFIADDIDRSKSAYAEKCLKASSSISKRWNVNGNVDTNDTNDTNVYERIPDDSKDTKTKTKTKANNNLKIIDSGAHTPQTVDEVIAYSRTLEKSIPDEECYKFFDHFSSNGWKVSGKTPMKDWKAAFRNWTRNIGTYGPKKTTQNNYEQHQRTTNEWDALESRVFMNLDD